MIRNWLGWIKIDQIRTFPFFMNRFFYKLRKFVKNGNLFEKKWKIEENWRREKNLTNWKKRVENMLMKSDPNVKRSSSKKQQILKLWKKLLNGVKNEKNHKTSKKETKYWNVQSRTRNLDGVKVLKCTEMMN